MMLSPVVRSFCVRLARVLWRWTGLCEFRVSFLLAFLRWTLVLISLGGVFSWTVCYCTVFPHPFCFLFLFCSTDEDTAEYLFDVLSSANDDPSWLTQERRVTVATIQGALQGLRGIGKGYEERVAEAL